MVLLQNILRPSQLRGIRFVMILRGSRDVQMSDHS